jgi:hypothetical protein
MADDWQVGDLALCVKGGRFATSLRSPEFPKGGAVYRVAAVGLENFIQSKCFALWLEDGPINNNGERVWPAYRFRKIRPHTPDAEDAETIRLLTGVPAKEPAA